MVSKGGNKPYKKGVVFERAIVNKAKAEGKIAYRTAASKSPIDCTIIDIDNKEITLIQAKKTKKGIGMTKNNKKDFENLSDEYMVNFKVINSLEEV